MIGLTWSLFNALLTTYILSFHTCMFHDLICNFELSLACLLVTGSIGLIGVRYAPAHTYLKLSTQHPVTNARNVARVLNNCLPLEALIPAATNI